jgi:hypothetical protein
MRRLAVRSLSWLAVVTLLVLLARWLAYALAGPSLLSGRLQGAAGGPSLVAVTLVCLGLALAVAAAAVWLAAVGVRERHRLRPERVPPRLRLGRAAVRAVGLYAASSFAFAMFESYLHWRAGIGFHGLSCLVGPVHRNAIPLLAALALVAAALAEAVSHLSAWMRATVRELLRPRIGVQPAPLSTALARSLPEGAPLMPRARPRAPPLPA